MADQRPEPAGSPDPTAHSDVVYMFEAYAGDTKADRPGRLVLWRIGAVVSIAALVLLVTASVVTMSADRPPASSPDLATLSIADPSKPADSSPLASASVATVAISPSPTAPVPSSRAAASPAPVVMPSPAAPRQSSAPRKSSAPPAPPARRLLSRGKPANESSHTDVYPCANITDGSQSSYWESVSNAFPQWVQVDLGTPQSASRIVMKLPASELWHMRTQTLSILGSRDGGSFTTVVGSRTYVFDAAKGNTATVTFPASSQRYFRVFFTANGGWPAAQLSELEIWNY